jgi:hypothetical protein
MSNTLPHYDDEPSDSATPEQPASEPTAGAAKPKVIRRRRRRRRTVRHATASHTVAAPAGVVPPPPAGTSPRNGAARETFLAAQDEFLDTVGDDSDEASRIRLQFRRLARKATHLQTCGPDCVLVEIDVPAAASNPHGTDYFRLGNTTYGQGKYTVYACVARELAYMIDKNRRVDDRRMREATHMLSAGSIRADRIRAET